MNKDGNTANDLIIRTDEDEESPQINTMQDTIKEMGKLLFKEYIDKTSNLSDENINGIITARSINEYMEVNFGYRHKVLDILVENKLNLIVSDKGFGVKSITELLKSIQASFEQHQLPDRIGSLFSRR